MSNGIYNEYELTKRDVKALRLATSIAFDFDNATSTPVSQIRAMKDGDDSHPFDSTVYVLVDSVIDVYPNNYIQTRARACEVLLYSNHSDEWQTIAKLLREGDKLRVEWVSNQPDPKGCYGQNARCTLQNYEGDALHFDDIGLKVIRGGKIAYAFNVAYSITPNNSASMIKLF